MSFEFQKLLHYIIFDIFDETLVMHKIDVTYIKVRVKLIKLLSSEKNKPDFKILH